MFEEIKDCILFENLNIEEIDKCLSCSGARRKSYKANQILFEQNETPKYIFVLVSGKVSLCKDSISGRRTLVTTFEEPGEIFGEAYAFLEHQGYDYYAMTTTDCEIYEIPKTFLSHTCSKVCGHHTKMIDNMLHILAVKNYNLNKKLQILSGHTLRQKIAMVVLGLYSGNAVVSIGMTREELADYIGTARPSLSRELMKMQDDGLIAVSGKKVKILDVEGLENCL